MWLFFLYRRAVGFELWATDLGGSSGLHKRSAAFCFAPDAMHTRPKWWFLISGTKIPRGRAGKKVGPYKHRGETTKKARHG
jgi:hypothetical protein